MKLFVEIESPVVSARTQKLRVGESLTGQGKHGVYPVDGRLRQLGPQQRHQFGFGVALGPLGQRLSFNGAGRDSDRLCNGRKARCD